MRKSISLIGLILIFVTGVVCAETAEEWINKGREAYEVKNYDESIRCLKKALTLNPNNAQTHYNLGFIYDKKGMTVEAISAFKKVIAINPNYLQTHYILGIIYGKKGMLDEAISAFKKAIAINPKHTNAHYNLGINYGKKGMWDESLSELKAAVELDPDNGLLHSSLGYVYFVKGKKALAAHHYYKAGLLFLKKGDRSSALEEYDKLKKTEYKELEQALFEKLYPELKQKKRDSRKGE